MSIYDEAAQIIQKAQAKEKTIKYLVYESETKNIRQLYALICESLKYSSILEHIMGMTEFLNKVPWMEKTLAQVLLYEFLFGKKLQGACPGKYRKAVVKRKKELRDELEKLKTEKGVTSNKDLLPDDLKDEIAIPRYARVNLLKTAAAEVESYFIRGGYTCVLTGEEARAERVGPSAQMISGLGVDIAKTLGKYEFAADIHLDDVFVFAAGTDFHSHPLYQQGDIILMDKASCIPAHALAAIPGSHVIDACAAPGNKTSHVASLMGNRGKLYSFDLDPKRVAVMQKLLDKAGVMIAETLHQDFLTCDPRSETYSRVEYIIVDPSCSGSGIVSRKDYLVDESMSGDHERLRSLQQLQLHILNHALSFPAVKRVVYSTCSIHRQENEDVVHAVLKQNSGFRLVPVLQETWDHRGLSIQPDGKDDVGSFCMRASPKTDLTNGFFVALFERKPKTEDPASTGEDTVSSGPMSISDCSVHNGRGEKKNKKKSKKRKIDEK